MRKLTDRQREVYEAVMALSANGIGATYSEVRARVGLAGQTAIVRHINILEERGFLVPRKRGSIAPSSRPSARKLQPDVVDHIPSWPLRAD